MLKPGGMMLYSTCTFDGRENERIIEHLREACPEFQILKISLIPASARECHSALRTMIQNLRRRCGSFRTE